MRSLFALGLKIVIVLGLLCLTPGCGDPKINKSNLEKITKDMSQADVEKLLGQGKEAGGSRNTKIFMYGDADHNIKVTYRSGKVIPTPVGHGL